ncbi:hypothetical protein PHZ_c2656 [Phenylobacterium zucineum HLK1]|uniref:Calcium-binding protein n=1 Tax=Phenylobacterium zucineum (strain HLK1) TaxID=450851 RepID=B4RHM4_PHEZH|nr:calcium-binding protein [Phenylobacterium zucineum]ACG79065.1 hypothetical protein PHZ_c2656 [Phenylobacterium zucineum HLK1]
MAWLFGTAGADTISGGAEDDLIVGHGGADLLRGGAGNDNIDLFESPANGAFVDGEDGDDNIVATGTGTLNGGAGDDSIEIDQGQFTVDGGAGDDSIYIMGPSQALVTLGSGKDVVLPSYGERVPSVVTDFQVGDQGDSILVRGTQARPWDGASNPFALGFFRVVQRGADAVLQWDADGAAGGQANWRDVLVLQNVQASQLTAANLNGWPADGAPPAGGQYAGSEGADRYTGGKGSDLIAGWGGADTLAGNDGHDTLYGGGGGDSLHGQYGDDHLYGEAGDDVIYDPFGSNFIRGGEGDDYIDVSGNGNLGSPFNDLHGNWGQDTIIGGRGGDWVVGGQGDDMLWGGSQGDAVYGNLGNDTCYGDDGIDWVRGGQGNDSLEGWYGDDYMAGDRGNDTISGGLGADLFHTFSGAGLDRVLDFNAAEGDRVNVLAGTSYTLRQEGADTIVDMGGDDRVVLVGVQLSSLPPGWIFS